MGDQWICCLLFQLLPYEYFILSKDPPWSHPKNQLLARRDSREWNLTGKVTKPTRGEGVAKKVMSPYNMFTLTIFSSCQIFLLFCLVGR